MRIRHSSKGYMYVLNIRTITRVKWGFLLPHPPPFPWRAEPPFVLLEEEKKRREILPESRKVFEVTAARISGLVNIVLSRQTIVKLFFLFFKCEHPFIDNQQSAIKWVETLRPKWTFWRFPDFKRGKDSVSSPIFSMQCCATVRATFRKQETSQLWIEGTEEGCGFLCFRSYPIWVQQFFSTILSPIEVRRTKRKAIRPGFKTVS